MKVAVIGATGLVGGMMLKVLEERNFPVSKLIPVASAKSVGNLIRFKNTDYKVVSIEDAIKERPDFALFSAGSEVSKKYAPEFAAVGTYVIDNSSAWRMYPEHKLVVPEVNAHVLTQQDKIIANPNCSTIQLVVAIAPLHKRYGIKRIVISTYQSVSGTGQKAIKQLENERNNVQGEMVYPYPIDLNCIPHGGSFLNNGYTTEEIKLKDETRKILGDQTINVTAMVVRVPVKICHSESVNIEFNKDFDLDEIRYILDKAPGVIVIDDVSKNKYPVPLNIEGKDDVYVGRIHRDDSQPNSLNMWIVGDNLRKGAATNAVQIAEYIIKMAM
ncbi:MAG: aspartate-semialdehyde dehydrogenase [Bacteroidetes bacterium]|nr:aspartate-semialdehyde dehydrogenase [Bacteroidota bacterium]